MACGATRGEGVETNLIKTSYSTAAGTAFVEFNNVKVPVENLLGVEHNGFIVISEWCRQISFEGY